VAVLALVLGLAAPAASATTAGSAAEVLPTQPQVIVTDEDTPPAADDPRWRASVLAQDVPGHHAWYRVRLDGPAPAGMPMLYLPYFYGGGRILLNGVPVAEVPHSTDERRVRWERPLLLPLPSGAWRPDGNLLMLQAHAEYGGSSTVLPRLVVGPQTALQPDVERRMFVVRTLPILTWVAGTVIGLLVLFIWLRRREEVLYGLFGLAALLWAQRSSTFVLEVHTPAAWEAWRLLYHLSTGGFVVVMLLFVLHLAGWRVRGLGPVLGAYAALGPLLFLVFGEGRAVGWWTAGLLPIGLAMLAVALAAAWRRREPQTAVIAAAVVASVLAGFHDQWVAVRWAPLLRWLPQWSDHRLFLLHHAANVLLLVMGVLLALRFARTLNDVEQANRTLESRVQQREREIAASYQRIAVMQREQAATDERQRIMRDLHDGLGSQLFTSLSRAERGAMDSRAMSDSLRGAIDQMRVAIEALASEEQDFETAFGNFRFRWDARLREAGIATTWQIELPPACADGASPLAPHDAPQLLHIVQEALTNSLKHARASAVTVRVAFGADELAVDVSDDGQGLPAPSASTGTPSAGGRGRANMRNRAQRLGGRIEWHAEARGTRVSLRAPWRMPPAPPGMPGSAEASQPQTA
jgi:signal transduction histidine kinase